MIGPVTRWRNRKAVKSDRADADFMAQLAEARQACADDLAELQAAGADETFGDLLVALAPPEPPGEEHAHEPQLTDDEWRYILDVNQEQG